MPVQIGAGIDLLAGGQIEHAHRRRERAVGADVDVIGQLLDVAHVAAVVLVPPRLLGQEGVDRRGDRAAQMLRSRGGQQQMQPHRGHEREVARRRPHQVVAHPVHDRTRRLPVFGELLPPQEARQSHPLRGHVVQCGRVSEVLAAGQHALERRAHAGGEPVVARDAMVHTQAIHHDRIGVRGIRTGGFIPPIERQAAIHRKLAPAPHRPQRSVDPLGEQPLQHRLRRLDAAPSVEQVAGKRQRGGQLGPVGGAFGPERLRRHVAPVAHAADDAVADSLRRLPAPGVDPIGCAPTGTHAPPYHLRAPRRVSGDATDPGEAATSGGLSIRFPREARSQAHHGRGDD